MHSGMTLPLGLCWWQMSLHFLNTKQLGGEAELLRDKLWTDEPPHGWPVGASVLQDGWPHTRTIAHCFSAAQTGKGSYELWITLQSEKKEPAYFFFKLGVLDRWRQEAPWPTRRRSFLWLCPGCQLTMSCLPTIKVLVIPGVFCPRPWGLSPWDLCTHLKHPGTCDFTEQSTNLDWKSIKYWIPQWTVFSFVRIPNRAIVSTDRQD